LTVFHNRHWDLDYQMVNNIINNKLLGELCSIESRVMTYGPEWSNYGVAEFNPQWRTQAAYGGGFLTDWGPHLVEQVLDLTGEWPASISCQLRSHLWATEVDDYFFVRIIMPSGLLITLEASNNARTPLPRWFIVGKEGTLLAKGAWGQWTEMSINTSLCDMPVDISPQGAGPSSGQKGMDVGETLSENFYLDLARCITTGNKPTVTAERARDVIAILEAAREANKTGVCVTPVPPKAS